ncbi:uncharacterized protein PHACADRAFT_254607 [Phanerochaete carnosa HHB-10118-sp]|uniref:Hcy-binding domain-containing protein n=1 Tax=Phanerochaete carnosa (strain HHB-10118-sp) TaxID=650164 RepID=K5VZQ4_PHACS|nr:uncharacterized protein PHACADRAFT_254607 [Phanerochaete carnosa HHB-10118-sp]EKM57068.1 hypothetical protein PHACADRAFT_254607 [Phanerochaete carnosa HHB-10118-sp]
MRQAVALACIAKDRFLVERTEARREDVQVALSLGPYGATLNANEFDGMYPPPYGPGPSASRARNSFSPCEEELRECSIEALKGFHLDRLRVFAEDRETWDSIDWVAFETVPLTREITAIRRAMGALNSELPARRSDSRWRKQWWISGVHPFGVYPEQSPDGGSVTAGHVVRAILEQEGAGEANPVPDGIGINCTGVRYLSSIVGEMGEVVVHVGGEQRPWLVLYPNGREWDVGTQSWVAVGADEDEAAGAWATAFAEAIMPCMRHGHAWGGVVIGGCCKSGPRDIVALVKVVKRVWETVHR